MGVGVWTKLAEGAVDETAQWLWVCVALCLSDSECWSLEPRQWGTHDRIFENELLMLEQF